MGGCSSLRLQRPAAILVGLCGFALLSGCGRIGFDARAIDDETTIDSGAIDGRMSVIDADLAIVDADPAAIDADLAPVDAAPVDAAPVDAVPVPEADATPVDATPIPEADATPVPEPDATPEPTCDLPALACPSESFSIGAGAIALRSGDLYNQPDSVEPAAGGCVFPLGRADYSYRIDLLDSGSVTISSATTTGWYLLDATCSGSVVMCSSVGGLVTSPLAAGTYTLVVENVGAEGVCDSFEIAFAAPP